MTAYNNTRKYRMRPALSLIIAVMFSMAGIAWAGICIAAQTDCEKLLSKEAYKTLSTEKIKQIQDSLEATGFDPKDIDGVIGPHTQDALKQFCVKFENKFRKDSIDDLLAKIFLYAAIAQDYPEWKNIVLNVDFESWIDQQPAEKRADYRKVMNSGTAKNIISLFKQYESEAKKGAEKKEKYVVSYKLTEEDLEQLKAEKDIAANLEDMIEKNKDKSFDSKAEFISAVQEAVKLKENDLNLIVKIAQQDNYTLTEISFETLGVKIPKPVFDGLNKFKDQEALVEDEFKSEVKASIEAAIQFDQYQPLVIKYAKVEGPYRISKEYLEKLKNKEVPGDVIAKLKTLPKKPYADINAFKEAVRPIIEDVTKKDNFPDPTITELGKLREEDPAKQRQGAGEIIQTAKGKYKHYQKVIIQEIDELPLYRYTDRAKRKLEQEAVPQYLIQKLEILKGKGYPTENLFKQALTVEIEKLTESYETSVIRYAEKTYTYKLTDRSIKKLKIDFEAETIPDSVMAKLENLQDIEYANETLFVNALAMYTCDPNTYEFIKPLKENTCETFKYQTRILGEARKEHPLTCKQNPIVWTPKSCGCLIDDLSGVVYGIYPFWLAGEPSCEKKKAKDNGKESNGADDQNQQNAEPERQQNAEPKILKQQLDFSVLTRIGYYAISFDENGDLYEQLPWIPKKNQRPDDVKAGTDPDEFLIEAREHRSDIDLVIYQNDWQEWSKLSGFQKMRIFDNLTSNIVKLINVKLTDFFSKIKPIVSFGGSPIPTIADGVTLYFEGYPEDKDSKYIFVRFIRDLRENLKALNEDYHLNVMLHMDSIGKGIYKAEILKQMIPSQEKGIQGYEDQDPVDYYLVFIGEPTTDTKKHLRSKVENLFEGAQRRIMLHKIIPIITPTRHDEDQKQLHDDIIYMKQNFGGIGFWTLPIDKGDGVNFMTCLKEILPWEQTQPEEEQTSEEESTLADDVNSKLIQNFRTEGAEPISGYQNFVTLHRWAGRIIFDLLLVMIVIFALLYVFICWFRALFARFWWLFMVFVLLFIWVFFSLLYFDPSWKNLAEGNLILFLMILGIAIIAIIMFIKRSIRGELP